MATSRRLLALLLLPLGLGLAGNDTNDICTQKDKPDFKLNLTAAMIFSDHLLMIDSKFMVYKIPQSHYEDSYGSLLLNISGIYITDFWPVLKGNKNWERIKPLYKRVYHVINNKGDFFLQMVPPGGVQGLCYNVQTNKACPLLHNEDDHTIIYEQIYIDAAHYAFSVVLVNGLPILRTWTFKFTSNEANTLYEAKPIDSGRVYYAVETKNPTNRNVTIIKGTDVMATPGNDPFKKMPGYEGYHLENITDWHLDGNHPPVGYIYKENLHLYVFDKVIIFADAMPSYDEQTSKDFEKKYPKGSILASTKMKVIKVANFFNCRSDTKLDDVTYPPRIKPHPIAYSMRPMANRNLWIIFLIVVLIVLVIIACCIYLFCFTEKARKRRSHSSHGSHKKSHKDKKHSKMHRSSSKLKTVRIRSSGRRASKQSHGTSKNSPFRGPSQRTSVRSRGVSQGKMLTRGNSKQLISRSARSRGCRKSSQQKMLTRGASK